VHNYNIKISKFTKDMNTHITTCQDEETPSFQNVLASHGKMCY